MHGEARLARQPAAHDRGTPGIIGSDGCVQSRAWIWLVSSTHSTSAFVGRFRYSPTMSPIFSTNSRSAESFNVSTRCGCRPNAFQIRTTAFATPTPVRSCDVASTKAVAHPR